MKFKSLKLVGGNGQQRQAALTFADKVAVANSRLFLVARVAICSALALLATAPRMHAQAPSPSDAVFPDGRQAGPDVSSYVSSALESGEHEYMRGAINQLPPAMKEKILRTDPTHVSISVYDGVTGEMHYNRPEIAGNLRVEPYKPLPGDDYPLAKAGNSDDSSHPNPERITSCGGSPAPGCTSGAGPYRRIFTPRVAPEIDCPSGVTRPCGPGSGTNDGYWVSGTVTTECEAGSFKKKGDVGFAFLGGYSKTPDETGGTVDAGLQYNYEDDPALPELDKYELFIGMLNEAKLVYSSTNPPGGGKQIINCGGKTSMEFRVAPWELNLNSRKGSACVSSKTVNSPWQLKACGTVAFILERGTGGIGDQHNVDAIVWLAPSAAYGGWGQLATSSQGSPTRPRTEYWPQVPCGGCIFKWTTGIGQEQEDLTDGSLYSVTWSSRGIAPWAVDPSDITDPKYGDPVPMTPSLTYCTEYPLWRQTYDAATAKQDCSDTPGNITGNAGDVKVANYTVEGELDSITLTDKGLPSVAKPRGEPAGAH